MRLHLQLQQNYPDNEKYSPPLDPQQAFEDAQEYMKVSLGDSTKSSPVDLARTFQQRNFKERPTDVAQYLEVLRMQRL